MFEHLWTRCFIATLCIHPYPITFPLLLRLVALYLHSTPWPTLQLHHLRCQTQRTQGTTQQLMTSKLRLGWPVDTGTTQKIGTNAGHMDIYNIYIYIFYIYCGIHTHIYIYIYKYQIHTNSYPYPYHINKYSWNTTYTNMMQMPTTIYFICWRQCRSGLQPKSRSLLGATASSFQPPAQLHEWATSGQITPRKVGKMSQTI